MSVNRNIWRLCTYCGCHTGWILATAVRSKEDLNCCRNPKCHLLVACCHKSWLLVLAAWFSSSCWIFKWAPHRKCLHGRCCTIWVCHFFQIYWGNNSKSTYKIQKWAFKAASRSLGAILMFAITMLFYHFGFRYVALAASIFPLVGLIGIIFSCESPIFQERYKNKITINKLN